MILLSYGMPKSASTFCYQVENEMLCQVGHIRKEICETYLPVEFHPAFLEFNNNEIIPMSERIPDDKILIVKTHTLLRDPIDRLLKSGKLKATATFRDPRDAAISLLNSGEKDRKQNVKRSFSDLFTIDQAIQILKNYEEILTPWLKHPNVLKLSYNLLSSNPGEAAIRIRDYLQIDADVTPVVEKFSGNLGEKVWEFNVGKAGRYKEYMNDKQIQEYSTHFRDLIDLMNSLDDQYKIQI